MAFAFAPRAVRETIGINAHERAARGSSGLHSGLFNPSAKLLRSSIIMIIKATDQRAYFQYYLEEFKKKQVIPYEKLLLPRKTGSICIPKPYETLQLDVINKYHVFPTAILSSYSQWTNEGRDLEVGDTIVQQLHVPPTPSFCLNIIVGVRICETFRDGRCVGYSYETLDGHVEKGISRFLLQATDAASSSFQIETYSRPATKVLGLVQSVSSWYQDICTDTALRHVLNSQ